MSGGALQVETKDGMLPNPRRRTGPALLGLTVAAILLSQVAAIQRFTVDDANITLRKARQLAAGHAPVDQPQGPPAEGYGACLSMSLLALPQLAHLDAVAVAKGLGVLAARARATPRPAILSVLPKQEGTEGFHRTWVARNRSDASGPVVFWQAARRAGTSAMKQLNA